MCGGVLQNRQLRTDTLNSTEVAQPSDGFLDGFREVGAIGITVCVGYC